MVIKKVVKRSIYMILLFFIYMCPTLTSTAKPSLFEGTSAVLRQLTLLELCTNRSLEMICNSFIVLKCAIPKKKFL
jgi:hypothetical protein